jgi:CheY-like chemotaxis protein
MAATAPLRILVIDDDAVMTELLSAVLGMRSHQVTTADSGEAALALLPSQTFDVVLTDLQLPGLRGHSLAAALRSAISQKDSSASTRLLGMSGSPPSDLERSAFDAFLLKPFTSEQLEEAAIGVAGASSTLPSEPSAIAPKTSVLDEAIVARLAKQLPPAKLKELYQLTLSDARMRLDLIQKAMDSGDLDIVRREAHAIKGGTGMVGASELHRLAAQAETAAAAGSAADTPAVADFLAACNRLESMLNTRFS